MRGVAFLILSTLLASPSLAAPKQWQPVGKWAFDTTKERCAAAHSFESGGKRVTLGFTLRPLSEYGTLLFEVPGTFRGTFPEDVKIEIGGQRMKQDRAMAAESAKPRHILFEVQVYRQQLAELAAARAISFSSPRAPRLAMEVPGMDVALASLDRCMSDLLERWGLSKQAQARIAEYPQPERSIHTYVSDFDYPDSALGRSAVGGIEARVMVSPLGAPSDCRLVRSSGHPDLDAMTCKVALRPRFKAAVDREGKPMASPYYFKINWVMP